MELCRIFREPTMVVSYLHSCFVCDSVLCKPTMVGLAKEWMIPPQALSKAYLSGSSSRQDAPWQGNADSLEHILQLTRIGQCSFLGWDSSDHAYEKPQQRAMQTAQKAEDFLWLQQAHRQANRHAAR
jgi:hypothetical protein